MTSSSPTARNIQDAAALARLSLAELDEEIESSKRRLERAKTSDARNACSARIKWLEAFRAKHHKAK